MTVAGVVSYLNARPLIDSLAARPDWELIPTVPADLLGMLERREVDVALLPVVDLARRRESLRLVSDACIAADGEVLTVRVFSRVPAERIRRLRADSESHTSVVLARLLWRRVYGVDLELVRDSESEAVLLIGDKVVTDPPAGRPHQIDLGAAWKQYTNLPMVFAAWTGRTEALAGDDGARITSALSAARDEGVAQAGEIAKRYAAQYGWPVELAQQYLTHHIRFRLDARAQAGLDRFLSEAAGEGLLG